MVQHNIKKLLWLNRKLILSLVICCSVFSGCYGDESNPYRHKEVLDPNGKFVVEWLVSWEEDRIYFNVTAETRGYVGLGLSRKGKMDGADIVIGGVRPNGQTYFKDYYAIGNQQPLEDESQDWTLHTAWESKTHTFLSFSRRFETCDAEHDLPINNDGLVLLWCYGERDRVEYHHGNRGGYDVHLLDPSLTPRGIHELEYRNVSIPPRVQKLGDWKVWTLPFSEVMPSKDTTYFCTIHKAPSHPRKQHIVGYRVVLNTEVERRHIHHLIFYKCWAPTGVNPDELFGPNTERREECYDHFSSPHTLPTEYCVEIIHEWSVGSRPIFFPDHVGLPFTETSQEYYMFQIHYDNPQRIPNIRLQYALEVYYTSKLREHDAGMMAIGAVVAASGAPLITVPPYSLSHIVHGHCAAECTKKMFPETGVNVFATKSHTHVAGRGVRYFQARNGKEMPILVDDNYNFNYQAYHILQKEVTILPGDVLGHWCNYETTDKNGALTLRGYTTQDEMCHGWIWYYPLTKARGTYTTCSSEVRSDVYKRFLGVNTTVFSSERVVDIVTSPPENAGLTTSEAISKIDWNIENRKRLQNLQDTLPQVSVCVNLEPDNIRMLLERREENIRNGTISDVYYTKDGPILIPGSEFISRYPTNLIKYQKPTRCSSKN